MSVGQGLSRRTASATLPSRNRRAAPAPRLPTITSSAPRRSASATRTAAGSPSRATGVSRARCAESPDRSHDTDGRHRLFEERQQHDEADKNSEKNRLERDIREHGHDREDFQVRGGS